jgi:Flp pilus assembly pilin Flp
MRNRIKLTSNQLRATAIEYGQITALIAVAAIGAMQASARS